MQGMILHDATCSSCGREAEILGEENCNDCGWPMIPHKISFHPTQPLDPVMSKVMSKSSLIRQRLQKRLPWRKSSESQSD